jgi:hypothetical protein
MKYTSFIILLFLFACTKQDIKKQPPIPDVCSFGITEFSTARRIGKGKPIKPPKNPTYPVNPSGVLLLDFDGHMVSGTLWNMGQDIIAAPSGLDQNEAQRVLDSVAFDYAEFNVGVTTDEAKYYAAPSNRRMRVVLTETYQWYPNNAGGVAYTNSFTWTDETPCFVFTSRLGYNIKNIQEAASHELGHTAGLRHQSVGYVNESGIWTVTSEYNPGNSWNAPIMGYPYNKVAIWWNGTNSYGVNQDDRLILKNTFL